MAALTKSTRPRKYWSDLRRQLSEKEGFSELSDIIGQLPLPSADGKMYPTDVANTETILRLIQSVPSPRAEPFKRWMARVGYERIQEGGWKAEELAASRKVRPNQRFWAAVLSSA